MNNELDKKLEWLVAGIQTQSKRFKPTSDDPDELVMECLREIEGLSDAKWNALQDEITDFSNECAEKIAAANKAGDSLPSAAELFGVGVSADDGEDFESEEAEDDIESEEDLEEGEELDEQDEFEMMGRSELVKYIIGLKAKGVSIRALKSDGDDELRSKIRGCLASEIVDAVEELEEEIEDPRGEANLKGEEMPKKRGRPPKKEIQEAKERARAKVKTKAPELVEEEATDNESEVANELTEAVKELAESFSKFSEALINVFNAIN